jgi:hypothetical protein
VSRLCSTIAVGNTVVSRCCMFRSRRSSLVKRLWRNRITHDEKGCSPEKERPEDLEMKSVAQSMLKRLKERQLDVLVQSVESKGGETTECVLLPKGDLRIGRRSVAPHVLCCRLWRWPDIPGGAELRRLPCCGTINDPLYMCCNPYHWSLLHPSGNLGVRMGVLTPGIPNVWPLLPCLKEAAILPFAVLRLVCYCVFIS